MIKILAVLALIASSVSCFASPTQPTRDELLKGCPTPERRDFPVNEALSPCQDFFQYACSKTIDSFTLPKNRSSYDFAINDSVERILYAKKKYLTAISHRSGLSERAEMIRRNYLACMDEKSSKADELKLSKEEIERISNAKTREELQELSASRVGLYDTSAAGVQNTASLQNPEWDDLLFSHTWMSLPERSYYHRADLMAEFESLVTELFRAQKIADPEKKAKWVVSFEKKLAEVAPLPAEVRDRQTKAPIISREEIQKRYPALKLDRFLSKVPQRVQVQSIFDESLRATSDFLANAPLEQIKAVFLYQSLDKYMDDAFPEYFAKKFAFGHKYLGGPEVRPDRQERCTKQVMGAFGKELDAEVLPILFPNFDENKVADLVKKIRGSIVNQLQKNDWLSDQGRQGAIKKIDSAKLFLVKPKTDKEWDFNLPAKYELHHRYENSKIFDGKALEKMLAELPHPRNREKWDMPPLTVNAYYDPSNNYFVLLNGILRFPVYDQNSPEVDNLATIGTVTGHELGHSIDDQGSQYDETGKIRAWMTEKDLAEFHRRGDQFISRFDQAGHNGKLTLGENIGDHVGLRASYEAAFPGDKGSVEDKRAFYTHYADLWCVIYNPSYRELLLKTNPHALGEARVNQQVKDHAAFQEAFGCKQGDPMYLPPSQRIKVW